MRFNTSALKKHSKYLHLPNLKHRQLILLGNTQFKEDSKYLKKYFDLTDGHPLNIELQTTSSHYYQELQILSHFLSLLISLSLSTTVLCKILYANTNLRYTKTFSQIPGNSFDPTCLL